MKQAKTYASGLSAEKISCLHQAGESAHSAGSPASTRAAHHETTKLLEVATELEQARHPGEVLYAEFMCPLGLTANRLALALNVSPQRIREILNRRRGVTAETALRLSKVFGTTPRFWLDLQSEYELSREAEKWGASIDLEIRPISFVKREMSPEFNLDSKLNQEEVVLVDLPLTEMQRKIYNLISTVPIDTDSICEQSAIHISHVNATLTILELEGLIRRRFGHCYVRTNTRSNAKFLLSESF